MPKRITPAKHLFSDTGPAAAKLRLVIVTMDNHLAGTAERAGGVVRQSIPGLTLSVHSAAEWTGSPPALQACIADIESADIVVAAMLFMEDHIAPVLPALRARRDHCDAMLACLSAPEVVRLTRLGRLDMSGEMTGAMALLKKLRGKPGNAAGNGKRQLRMLRHLPKILRYIPGTAQDLRAYFLGLQYWLAGSEDNISGLIRLLVTRYADGPRAALRALPPPPPPIEYPDVGVYHPRLRGRISGTAADLPAAGGKPRVGVLLMRSYVLAGNTGHYDGVLEALEARGMAVVPAFASGLDARCAVDQYFFENGKPAVDAVVSLTGFSLVGGPAYNDAKAAEAILARLDVPYVAAHPVEFQTLQEWENGERGLTPVEATMMVAIPELDGAIGPITFGGRDARSEKREMVAHAERAVSLAARVARLVALRRRDHAERRLAIVLFNFPPNAGATGTAAYLSVFASLFNVLRGLRDAGYRVEMPDSVDALRDCILKGNAERFGSDANVAARISADDYVRNEPYLREIEAQWGPAPGRALSDGSSIFVLGAHFGNVFVGVQPGFGYEGDPMRLLFERSFAPTHAFTGFYRWLRETFKADAVLHFGTHGALEFMPGKQVGLSAACWPDRLIGDLPNFYLYAGNNPSEGMIAKRRAGATLISYLTPPVTTAGLYRGLADLKASLDRWRALPPEASAEQREPLRSLIETQAQVLELSTEDGIDGLALDLAELENTLIPYGLHVIGQPPAEDQRREMLQAAGVAAEHFAGLDKLMAEDHEIPAVLHALDGGYIRPAPGGDLLRTTDVLPSGRNIHGFDPLRIPSVFAIQDGAQQADKLLARQLATAGRLPETVAIVLWGSDNLKTEGGAIAQALWLMGAEPRQDSYGRLCGAQLIPLDRLGRPRIDVVMTLSGIFRDLLPLQVRMLAEAAQLAATADEPLEQNFIRAHAEDFAAKHGVDIAEASLRVFGNSDGAYGANVNLLLENGGWKPMFAARAMRTGRMAGSRAVTGF
jgi:magnesium chelatase subunit H